MTRRRRVAARAKMMQMPLPSRRSRHPSSPRSPRRARRISSASSSTWSAGAGCRKISARSTS
jgi:hypothetical protein